MAWTVRQFGRVVHEYRERPECSDELWDEIRIAFSFLIERGNLCGRPVSAPLRDGIFELRAKAHGVQARFLYFFSRTERQVVIVAHSLTKKTNKIPPTDIDLALKRKSQIERMEIQLNDFRPDQSN
jgi:phage-related protein